MTEPGRRRIAILGGGIGGLSAAFELTSEPDWQSRYEVTLYQLGWRLGGKGASSRNLKDPDAGRRIEEHGLHVWFGCYDRAFAMLRRAYEEIGRPADHPFPTALSAFTPQDSTPFMEWWDGTWRLWPMSYPPNAGSPGDPQHRATAWDHLKDLVEFAVREFEAMLKQEESPGPPPPVTPPDWLQPHLAGGDAASALHQAHQLARSLPDDPSAHAADQHHGIVWLLLHFRRWLHDVVEQDLLNDLLLRRSFIAVDLGVAIAKGMLADGVPLRGYAAIDDEDLRAWLTRHGAHDVTIWSAPIRATYDLCFGYRGGVTGTSFPGDRGDPSFGAGAALYTAIRLATRYNGHVAYEMRAGMGEVVIAPIYEALRKRGVRFEFFSRVKHLALNAAGDAVEKVFIGRQALLAGASYDPLITVQGIPCWPDGPRLEQLRDGAALAGVNLESYWNNWQDRGATVLEAGRDFDHLVLAISLDALKPICGDLSGRIPRWRDLFDHVQTVQTQSAQLWLTRDLAQTGWTAGAVPIDAGPEPLDVWADRSESIAREAWPPAATPLSVQYLCGPLAGPFGSRPPGDKDVPAEAQAAVRRSLIGWIETNAAVLWPGLVKDGAFDWSALYDPKGRAGPARLEAQWLRANVDPTERYVLSVAGTTRYRFMPGDTGLRNLVAAGDWTVTPFNAGCIEAAVTSGINAIRAIQGRPAET